jgi:soluble lytic murein transglycosylase-like protein
VGISVLRRLLASLAFGALVAGCAGPHAGNIPVAPPPAAPNTAAMRDSAARADSLLGVWTPALGPPRATATGFDWSPRPRWSRDVAAIRVRLRSDPDSDATWRSVAAEPGVLRPFALRRLAWSALRRGDTLTADGMLDTLSSLSSPWTWDALRARCDLWVARGRPAAADSLLERAERDAWSDLDRAAWLARRAGLRAASGDTTHALDFAWQIVRRYPGLPPAATAFGWIETWSPARGRPLDADDLQAGAEVARLQADRHEALRRLERAAAQRHGRLRAPIDLRLAQVAREADAYDPGLAAAARVMRDTDDPVVRGRAKLEKARLLRDAGRSAQARDAFVDAERHAGSDDVREAAAWEGALELEDDGAWAKARASYDRIARRGGSRADDAAFRAGLLWLAQGRPDSAYARWPASSAPATTVWREVARRRAHHDPGAAKPLLDADRPWSDFYQAIAMDSLPNPDAPPVPRAIPDSLLLGDAPMLDLAERLVALGYTDDAMLVIRRWNAGIDVRRSAAGDSMGPDGPAGGLLRASALAYAAGRPSLGIQLARKALDATPQKSLRDTTRAALRASMAVWMFPATFDSLYSVYPAAAAPDSLDRTLLRAVAWQESKFEPRARSRSNALGLMQLKLGTARDMARRLGDPTPTETTLFEPAQNVRFGHEYLEMLLARFDGHVAVAVAAYNAGPGGITSRWRELVDHGGELLFCELIDRPETRDYVRQILMARQAYRRFTP